MSALPPPDARRAAFRTRDALRAAFARPGAAAARDGAVETVVAEPEAAVPVEGLARALAAAAALPETPLAPGAGWSGAPFAAPGPYVAPWELHLAASLLAGGGEGRSPADGTPPLLVRAPGAAARAEAFAPWLVHSFAGRKGHARPDVLALVPPSTRRVLDVGCGEGALGAALEARGARVAGVEPDPEAAAVASSRLSLVLPLRAEEALASAGVRPDVVILADVLEHLRDPLAVLRAARAALAPGGLLVFSVPNATHASVLAGLFRGLWTRELEGIVADDHRLYAGRAGWVSLLAAGGFRVTSLRASEARTPFASGDREAFLSAGLEPAELDAVQWLGTAEPAGAPGTTDIRGAVEEDGPLGSEDPVGEVLAAAEKGAATFEASNPARGMLVETLLRGGLVAGTEAAALQSGWTPSTLARRFEGSGFDPSPRATSVETLPGAVRAVVESRRRADLPTDEEALAAVGWSVSLRPSSGAPGLPRAAIIPPR